MTSIILTDGGDYLVTPSGSYIVADVDDPVVFSAANLPRFYVAEITTYKPGTGTLTLAYGDATFPDAALSQTVDTIESTGSIIASDVGYRTAPTDSGGPISYPPIMDQAFQIDVRLNLSPAQSGIAAAWGAIQLFNPSQMFDAIAYSWNSDGRAVTIRTGQKGFDTDRQIFTDPAYSTLTVVFAGVATPWTLSDTGLKIPLRDATYWLERPLQASTYAGSGTYEGTAALTGMPKPKTRGGTSSYPVRNVTPTLIDPTNRIYQYTDGAGTVVALYEGAATVITFDANTSNLYSGSTPAGKYRTDNSRGLFQLGSAPVHTITADVTGEFPVAGVKTVAADIARYVLTEDLLLPSANINTASFTTAASAFPYIAGFFWGSDQIVNGLTAAASVIASWGARIVPWRDGTLRLFSLRALAGTETPEVTLSVDNLESLIPIDMPSDLAPPPYRFRVEYAHNYTIQTSDINTASATAAQQQFVQQASSFGSWSSASVLAAYRRPNDPAPVLGGLQVAADATAVATALGALWGARTRLYHAVVPLSIGITLEIGDVVRLVYAMDDLNSGRLGQIVGYRFQPGDASITVQVLV